MIRQRMKQKTVHLHAMRATWVLHMRNSQFTFEDAIGTISHDGRTIRFARSTWKRTGVLGPEAPHTGYWRSSSGSIFLVTPLAEKRFYVLNFSRIGSFISEAKWVADMVGSRFQYKGQELQFSLSPDTLRASILNQRTEKTFAWQKTSSFYAAPGMRQ